MNIKPIVTYVACTLASFALTHASVAAASTYFARYAGMSCQGGGPNDYVANCPWVTNNSFNTPSVQELIVSFQNSGGYNDTESVAICQQSTSSQGCSVAAYFTVNGTRDFPICDDQTTCPGTSNMMKYWYNYNSAYTFFFANINQTGPNSDTYILGYKVIGN